MLLVRMINPAAQAAYPTRTKILAVTGDPAAKQGQTVTLTARCGGVVPRRGAPLVRAVPQVRKVLAGRSRRTPPPPDVLGGRSSTPAADTPFYRVPAERGIQTERFGANANHPEPKGTKPVETEPN